MILSSWSNWAENCTQVYVAKSVSLSIAPSVRVLTWSSRYPESVPSGTAIPNWAFLDVTATDTFNAIAAEADGGKSFKHTNSSCLKVGCRYTWVDRVVYNTYWYYLRFVNTYGCTLAPACIKAIQVLFQVVWSEVWSVWHSLPGPLSSSCVAAKPKLRSRLLMVLMIKVHPVKLFWTLLPSCNNFLNLLTTKRRITAPTNMLVTTPNHSTTLMIPAFGPKILGSTQLIFTQQLLVRDNSPTAHLGPGITLVFVTISFSYAYHNRTNPTFSLTNPWCHNDVIMTSSSMTSLLHHYDIILHLWPHFTPLYSTTTSSTEHYKYDPIS